MAAFIRGVCLGDARLADAVTRVAIGGQQIRVAAREVGLPYSKIHRAITRLRAAIETAALDHVPGHHRETPCKC